MTGAPNAPWPLVGETATGLARWRGGPRPPLPAGLSPMPGRWLVTVARYLSSPVGPYVELAVGRPARLGHHAGWCLVVHAVDSQAARVGGMLNWGFPSEVQPLLWESDGAERGVRWPGRGLTITGRSSRVALPMLLRLRALQRRSDGPVFVPGTAKGLGRFARIVLEAERDDELAPLAGSHPGFTVNGWHLRVDPPRPVLGLLTTLRRPLEAPVPQLRFGPRRDAVDQRPLAMVSPHPGG